MEFELLKFKSSVSTKVIDLVGSNSENANFQRTYSFHYLKLQFKTPKDYKEKD